MNLFAETLELARVNELLQSGEAANVRRRAGVTQSQVARTIGVRPATVCRWEKGERTPTSRSAVRLGALLDDLARIVSADDDPPASGSRLRTSAEDGGGRGKDTAVSD